MALETGSPSECAQYQEQLVNVRLSQPQWRSTLADALADATESGRMVMLFSTVGGVRRLLAQAD